MRTSTVVHPLTKATEDRPWTLPLIIIVCRECRFVAIAVSADAADLALWDHGTAMHLGVERVAAATAEKD